MTNLKIIGRKERASFPHLGLADIELKVDTGAYTSSIHCEFIEFDGDKVTCIFLDASHPNYTGEIHTFEVIKEVAVKSSNGIQEIRVMIETSISIFSNDYLIHLTLTDRSNMNYPILLGRKFLSDKFLVDVRQKHQNDK